MITIPISDGSGTLERHEITPATGLRPRFVDVWLPPGYAASDARYPVIYMHDGQNLFDPEAAFGSWGAHTAVTRLMEEGVIAGAIVVGVWNAAEHRVPEYMPHHPVAAAEGQLERFEKHFGVPPRSDDYLRFLVEQVKPLVDATYRTLTGPQHTVVAGSSMGGLISLYAFSQHPEVFGRAGCLSTHWTIGGELLVDGMAALLPAPTDERRIYFDYGTAGIDADYPPFQQRFDEHLRAAGYVESRHWQTHAFPGAEHNEAAWRDRLHLPFAFLLRD